MRAPSSIDWRSLRTEILETFTPGPPINEVAQFTGRKETIQRLQDITIEKARHAIIFGERGVGKTSLANIFHKDLNSTTRRVNEIAVFADFTDSFDSLWRKVFRRIKWPEDEATLDMQFSQEIEPDHVFLQLSRFKQSEIPIIIIDEYDRLQDESCKALMNDVIKALTRAPNNPTIILVGVGENILSMVQDHASISRNLVQVPMHRMSVAEIREVITSRIRRLEMRITDNAVWRITHFSAGLPFYAHSLGKYSALTAVENHKLEINEDTVIASIDRCMADVDYTVAESYTRATEKIYRKGNIFAFVLAACALAEQNNLGQFTAASIEDPLSAIMGAEYKVPSFTFHLNEMSTDERGNVLVKSGTRKTYKYHFREAAMQPYVIMKSLKEKILKQEVYERFYLARQKYFDF